MADSEESADSEWPTALEDESLDESLDESGTDAWPTALEDDSLADSEESADSEWSTALEDASLAEGDYESSELLDVSEDPAAGDDDALGMNGMESNQEYENLWDQSPAPDESKELELPEAESDAFAQADDADPFFGEGMSSDEGFAELDSSLVDDEDAALMSAFDSDADEDLGKDMGFDEPQPYPGTTGADMGLDGEDDVDDMFSSDMSASEFAEESQAAEETVPMSKTDESADDEFDLDMFGEQPEPWSEVQGNGSKKGTGTENSYDEESDDPLAALLADADDESDAMGQAGAFESEEEFDPLAELFAEDSQESDKNSESEETDDLDSLFSDDLNGGNFEDPFADLELAESPSGQTKKKR